MNLHFPKFLNHHHGMCSADDESVSVTDNRTLHIAPRTSAVLTATIKNIKNIKRGHREYK